LIWFDLIWFDLIWFDLIWFDLIWFDLIWFESIEKADNILEMQGVREYCEYCFKTHTCNIVARTKQVKVCLQINDAN